MINLTNYDVILGTPFLFQHRCIVGFNPSRVIIRSKEALPIRGASIKPAGSRKPITTVPNPIVATVNIVGKPTRALIDSGSLCDFMSTTLADQLNVQKEELGTPLMVNLAVQGSRTKVNYKTKAEFGFEDIKEMREFDLINLANYDLILGTPFLYQRKVMLSFNKTQIAVESIELLPIKGVAVKTLESRTAHLRQENLEEVRKYLRELAKPLCRAAEETDLPPLREINHKIDLIDEDAVYPWRASKCPAAFLDQWVDKRNAYLKSKRWEVASARNIVPMLFIAKPERKPGEKLRLRTVFDLRA